MNISTGAAGQAEAERTFLGHPRGLVTLFFTEMWERFSFYGMRALLVLYLTQHFLFSDDAAQGLYGAYAALVYLMPVLGGFIADRFLGPRKAVTIGAVLLVMGHFGMAFEGRGSTQLLETSAGVYEIEAQGRGEDRSLFLVEGERRLPVAFAADGVRIEGATTAPAFVPQGAYSLTSRSDTLAIGGAKVPFEYVLYLSLALIIAGVGFLKANISTSVGLLYREGDPRRDAGFTIFYMGINLGSLMATLACGYLGQTYGWSYGFGLAGIGMTLGLVQYLMGQKHLQGVTDPPRPLSQTVEGLFWIGGLLAVIPLWFLIREYELMEQVLTFGVPAIFGGMFLYAAFGFKQVERGRMIAALVLMVFSVIFWMLFEQAGSSLTLFAERNTDLTVVGSLKMTAAQTQFFNPFFIVTLAAPLSLLWQWLATRKREPSTPVKFSLGLIQVGVGFLILVFGAQFAGPDFRTPVIWLALAYLLHTLGELFLSPVGLSMTTKLSAARVIGLMMGVWFLSSSLAHILAARIAQLTSQDTVAGQVLDPAAQLASYTTVFTQIGWTGVGAGALLLLLTPWLKRAMHGVN